MKLTIALNSQPMVSESASKLDAAKAALKKAQERVKKAKAKLATKPSMSVRMTANKSLKSAKAAVDRWKREIAKLKGDDKAIKKLNTKRDAASKAKKATAVKNLSKPHVPETKAEKVKKYGFDPDHPDHKKMLKHLDKATYGQDPEGKSLRSFERAAKKAGFDPKSKVFRKKAEQYVTDASKEANRKRALRVLTHGERRKVTPKHVIQRAANMIGNKPESAEKRK